MIDTNKLRRLAQAATPGPDGVSLNWFKLLQNFQKEANPAAVSELLDRLEVAESEALEQARLNGMGSEREAALMAKLEAAKKDIAVKEEVIDSLAAVVKRLDAQCDAAERERDECNRRRLEAAGHFAAQTALMKKKYDDLRAELDALKSREGEVVYRWLALDYSGFCYGSNPPDNLPNRCNLKAFYAPAEVAP